MLGAKAFQKLLDSVGGLSHTQFKQFVHAYTGQNGQDAGRVWDGVIYSISERHLNYLGINRRCPDCASAVMARNGVNGVGVGYAVRIAAGVSLSLQACSWKKPFPLGDMDGSPADDLK